MLTFRISFVYILCNQEGWGGVRKDYMITGGEEDLKGPKKGLRNQSIAPYLQKIKIFLGKEFTAPCLEN